MDNQNIAMVDINHTFVVNVLEDPMQMLCLFVNQVIDNVGSMKNSVYAANQVLIQVTLEMDILVIDVERKRLIDAENGLGIDDGIVYLCHLTYANDDGDGDCEDAFDDWLVAGIWPRFLVFDVDDICNPDALSYEALWIDERIQNGEKKKRKETKREEESK